MNLKDPKKASVILGIITVPICIGLLIFAVVSRASIWAVIVPAAFIVFFALVFLAVRNRRTELGEDGFTYRTWLGNEYQYMYKDVIWYRLAEHEVWVYTRERRLVVDTDSENGLDMVKKLKAFGVPDKNTESFAGITDENGEEARQVLWLDQRKTLFWVMLILAAVMLALGILLIAYGAARDDEFVRKPAAVTLWLTGISAFSGYLLYIALRSINTRVELYRDHFIYRNALGIRKSYSYGDCVSRREKRFSNTARFYVKLKMRNGRRLFVDDRILKEGFGAAIRYSKLPRE